MEVVAALLGLGAVLAVMIGVLVLYLSRQRALTRRVASFSCTLHDADTPTNAWQPGIAQYGADRLLWWRTLSLAPRPARSWSRSELTLVERRPTGEADEEGRPLLLVLCRHGSERFELMMSAPACSGLVSWLEAGPRPVGRVI